MKMELTQFRVTNFKSIKDSGWVRCDSVTTLVGVNESGKSNMLLALWKLNPAKGGHISFTDDMPVKSLSDFRAMEGKPTFITADFKITSPDLLSELVEMTGCNESDVATVRVSKDYDGKIMVEFPSYKAFKGYSANKIQEIVHTCESEVGNAQELKSEQGAKAKVAAACAEAIETLSKASIVDKELLEALIAKFERAIVSGLKTSHINVCINSLIEKIGEMLPAYDVVSPSEMAGVVEAISAAMPKFVYYSNYGNLDSEIYLPHVIDNMKRSDLPASTEAKVRTLRTLFEYVQLKPEEILSMGDFDRNNPNDESAIKTASEKTKEREILLQSASAKLTREFKEWWKQGEYSFDLRADGRHFRIWVSDSKRPERIVLENRSTGLQWFLSFYIVFLVESNESHENAILLLDEAGMSLHPLAQKDLIMFFENLAKTNQIIHTTHSPFLVDTNNIDRVKVVYVDSDGYTVVSDDLRATEDAHNSKSVYAVHAALGLTVSDVILQGCRPVIVEGTSDQYYFNAIKQYLIGKEKIHPSEELVFIPSGGVKAISQLASLLSSKTGLPYVIVDSDASGESFKQKLCKDLYVGNEKKVISISEYTKVANAEVEDIIPIELISKSVERYLNNDEDDFADCYDPNKSLLMQIESFAKEHSITLPHGYKVEFAKQAKQTLLKKKSIDLDEAKVGAWVDLFARLLS